MARNARQILTKAIQDIEDGKWKQGGLIEDGPGAPDACVPTGKCDVYMGCALGLVAMHGGHGKVVKNGKWFHVKYPDDSAPSGVQKAVRALYAALPKKSQYKYEDDLYGDEWDVLNESVYDYNDTPETDARAAAKWFKKALANL